MESELPLALSCWLL